MPFHLLPNQMNLLEGLQRQLHYREFQQVAHLICSAYGISLEHPHGMYARALSSEQLDAMGLSTAINRPDDLDPDASKVEIAQRKQAHKDAEAQLAALPVIVEDLLRAAGPTCRAAMSHPIYGTTRVHSTDIIDWCLMNCKDFQPGDIETLEDICANFDNSLSFEANLATYMTAHSQLEEQQAGLSPMKQLSLLKKAVQNSRLGPHLQQFIHQNNN